MNKIFSLLVLVSLSVFLAACKNDKPMTKPKENVLKDYIKTPLDKAEHASDELEERNQKLLKDLE